LLACETLLPVVGALPVTWQTLDMTGSSGYRPPGKTGRKGGYSISQRPFGKPYKALKALSQGYLDPP
jgi:hypothetical protein